jgi:hypothetical protein
MRQSRERTTVMTFQSRDDRLPSRPPAHLRRTTAGFPEAFSQQARREADGLPIVASDPDVCGLFADGLSVASPGATLESHGVHHPQGSGGPEVDECRVPAMHDARGVQARCNHQHVCGESEENAVQQARSGTVPPLRERTTSRLRMRTREFGNAHVSHIGGTQLPRKVAMQPPFAPSGSDLRGTA